MQINKETDEFACQLLSERIIIHIIYEEDTKCLKVKENLGFEITIYRPARENAITIFLSTHFERDLGVLFRSLVIIS